MFEKKSWNGCDETIQMDTKNYKNGCEKTINGCYYTNRYDKTVQMDMIGLW